MADYPRCPNNLRGVCERSQVVLLNEGTNNGEEFWAWGCETCKLTFVRTKPVSQKRGQYAKELRDHEAIERRLRRWEARTRFFVPRNPAVPKRLYP